MDKIKTIFAEFKKLNPIPHTELEFKDNFTLLVAVMLSAQATDISVNKATKILFSKYFTVDSILSLGVDGLKLYIKNIGLYNSKATNIIATCKVLITKHNRQVPDNFEDLVALPGVGRKTANVVLNCAFGKPTIAVDTHVYRVSRRLGLAHSSTPYLVEKELQQAIPDEYKLYAHHWLILHGRYYCTARRPKCDKCFLAPYCSYKKEFLEKL